MNRSQDSAFVLALVALAASLRAYGLGSTLPLGNEYLIFYNGLHPGGLGDFLSIIRDNPLHLLLDQLSVYAVSHWTDSLLALRLPSCLWGCAAIWACWRLARRELGFAGAFTASFLLAISLHHIEWSRRAEFYAAAATIGLFQTDAYLDLLRGRGSIRYALWTCLLLYCSPYALCLGLFQALLARKRRFGCFLRAWGLAGVAFLPWAAWTAPKIAGLFAADFSSHHPGLPSAGYFFRGAPLVFALGTDTVDGLSDWALSSCALLAVVFLAAWAWSLRAAWRHESGRLLRLCHFLVAFGIPLIAALDRLTGTYYDLKQIVWILPFYLIGVSDGLNRWRGMAEARLGRTPAAWLGCGAGTLALILFLPVYYSATTAELAAAGTLRRIISEMNGAMAPGDRITFSNDRLAQDFLFHFDRSAFANSAHFRTFPDTWSVRGGRNTASIGGDYGNGSTWYLEGNLDGSFSVFPPVRQLR